MEEDKKKKRNKKKKNKQNKMADDAPTGAEETASATKNQLSNGKEEHEELSDSVDAGSSNVDSNAHQINATANVSFASSDMSACCSSIGTLLVFKILHFVPLSKVSGRKLVIISIEIDQSEME